jgi:hypothetical protein
MTLRPIDIAYIVALIMAPVAAVALVIYTQYGM